MWSAWKLIRYRLDSGDWTIFWIIILIAVFFGGIGYSAWQEDATGGAVLAATFAAFLFCFAFYFWWDNGST